MIIRVFHFAETSPTTVLCFSPFVKKSALQRFNISLLDLIFIEHSTSYPNVTFTEFNNEAFYRINVDFTMEYSNSETHTDLNIGSNNIETSEGQQLSIVVEELLTLDYGICYKINGQAIGSVAIKLHEDLVPPYGSDGTIPYIYITSEENAYGILDTTWINGDETKFPFHNLIPYSGAINIFNLKAIKSKFINESRSCSERNYFNQCFVKTILEADYNCSRPCLSLTLPYYDQYDYLPQCETWEDFACMVRKVQEVLEDKVYEMCPTACEVVEYSGKVLHTVYLDVATFEWSYDISNRMVVNEEYVVYDFSGFISSVGGTIGLFIGFSFQDLILPGIHFFARKFSKSQH